METRTLGKTGLRVSLIGLGCNNFGVRQDLAETRSIIGAAIDCGVTLFDTADSYGKLGGSETLIGEVLGQRRKDIVLATKFASPMDPRKTYRDASRGYIMAAVEASLRRLRTDWIDLYQMHWPDFFTPIEETLRALDDLVRQGKVRYIGCSNLAAWQVADAAWTSRCHGLSAFASAQNEFSLLARDTSTALLPALAHYGMGLLPYYPLASGMLTGKYKRTEALPEGRLHSVKMWADRFLTERNWTTIERLDAFAQSRGRTIVELAFGWLAAHPTVSSVIAGASTADQVRTNASSVGWKLTADDMADVSSLIDGS